MNFTENGKSGTITDKASQRCFTATEFDALVKISEVFEIAGIFGAMNSSVDFNNRNNAWRMVPVLRKK